MCMLTNIANANIAEQLIYATGRNMRFPGLKCGTGGLGWIATGSC